MSAFIVLAILIAVAVVPIMVGARIVNARNSGFGSALIAVLLLSALSFAIAKYVPNQTLAFLASAAGGGLVLAGVLDTTFWRGMAVSVIAVVVQFVMLVLFAGAALTAA